MLANGRYSQPGSVTPDVLSLPRNWLNRSPRKLKKRRKKEKEKPCKVHEKERDIGQDCIISVKNNRIFEKE